MAPRGKRASRAQQRPPEQQPQQPPQQPPLAGCDDDLPSALPAFPQPVSGQPNYFAQQRLPPVSSLAQQQQQQVPYDVAVAPFRAGAAGAPVQRWSSHGSYGGDAGVPLLGSAAGFAADMLFANRQVRHAFLRRVLAIVTLQLLAAAAIGCAVVWRKPVRCFLRLNPWALGLAAILATTLLLLMACSEAARRRHPTNLLLLAAFTASGGLLAGVASATYGSHVPLLALFLSAAVCLALIVAASQTGVEFSAPGGILLSALVLLASVGAADAWLGFRTLQLLIAGCGSLLFVAYLVCDVAAMAAGESCYQVSADEAVFCAANVATDPINLALHGLRLLGRWRGGGSDDDD